MTPNAAPPSPETKEAKARWALMPGPGILEPHESLRYVGRLFKTLAVGLFLILLTEIGLGISQDGIGALPVLLLEVAQLLLFTGLMWGGGDLAYMVIETNHDIRATRTTEHPGRRSDCSRDTRSQRRPTSRSASP